MSEQLPIHESFLESIGSRHILDLAVEATELTLDSIVDSEVLRRLPVVGTIVNAYGAVKTVRERFLLKKLYRFFESLADMPQDERETAYLEAGRRGYLYGGNAVSFLTSF